MSVSSPPTTSDPPGGDPARDAERETKPDETAGASDGGPRSDEPELRVEAAADADAESAEAAEAAESAETAEAAKASEVAKASESASADRGTQEDRPPAEGAEAISEEVEVMPEPVRARPTPTKPPPPPTKRPVPPKDGTTPTPPPARASQTGARAASDLPPRQWPPAVVADIMTRKLIALGEADPVIDLEGGMKRFRFRHLPVVGPGNKLVGLITHRDLLRMKREGEPDASDGAEAAPDADPPPTAGSIMRRDVLTARPDTPVASAARVMVQKKIGCLPVILEDNTLVGIITDTDYVLLAIELLERA